ncbi:MAG: DUF4197 domain-containing protein [Chitinophagaceae bacterium]
MKKLICLPVILLFFCSCETLMQAGGTVFNKGVTQQEADLGIREALTQGIGKGITFLNTTNGFFGNEAYKLLLPAEAVKIENTLRSIGLGSQVDKAILQINRSAEDAIGYAKPIFTDAIRQMTLTDALNIIKGSKNSATSYFRNKTESALIATFTPIIKSSLDKLNATRYYSDIINTYNKLPTTRSKVNPDLVNYVAERATVALFDQVEKEEINIRENPVARTTQILKKVFGSQFEMNRPGHGL